MQARIRVGNEVLQSLRCPTCHSKLGLMSDSLKCVNPQCEALFPIVDGIPVVINQSSSLFSVGDLVCRRDTSLQSTSARGVVERLKQLARKLVPDDTLNIKSRQNYLRFAEILLQQNGNPLVLVLGGRIVGQGLAGILSHSSIQFVETDVSFGPRTALICDACDIPFDDGTVDGVIIQAVLEHVVDPYRCVEEIHRALKDGGLVYAETSFMQQVHGGGYDFTRFTHIGHRRLFRKFDEISSGAVCGPGMALLWSYQYFLLSFVRARFTRDCIKLFTRLSAFWLKYFDYILIDKPAALDAASSYFFMGRRSNRILSEMELVSLYRGCVKGC